MFIFTSIVVSVLAAIAFYFTQTKTRPSLAAIRASNAAFVHSSSPVAVFVGATSGIGEAMALSFAEQTKGNSNIVIVGRNRAAAERIFAAMPTPPPSGSDKRAREFVQCDVTLMKNVQAATQNILSRYPTINYLVMSPGMMTLGGRDETSEGNDKKLAVHYYARWKFLHDLLPALKKAKEGGEQGVVMSVLAAGRSGAIYPDDLALKDFSLWKVALVAPAYNDMMMESFSQQAPDLTFIHSRPGLVRTQLMSSSNSLVFRSLWLLLLPITRPFSISAGESGQYMWNAIYNTATKPGVWRTGSNGEDLGRRNYIGDESQRNKVWEHTVEVMKAALASPESQGNSEQQK